MYSTGYSAVRVIETVLYTIYQDKTALQLINPSELYIVTMHEWNHYTLNIIMKFKQSQLESNWKQMEDAQLSNTGTLFAIVCVLVC